MAYKIRNVLGLFSLAIALTLVATPPALPANSYYVFDGTSLQSVIGNPGDVHADQWAAFYFKKGASTTELSQRWGMDLQDSPEAALRSVESNQQFEKRYEKWCQCGG